MEKISMGAGDVDKMPGRPNNGPLSPAERVAFRDLELALNRRVAVEEVLTAVANGKRDLLTREECRGLALKLGVPGEPPTLAQDVVELVIAAREYLECGLTSGCPELDALDKALEAFSSRVPYENEPE